jgi:hypothetical protein
MLRVIVIAGDHTSAGEAVLRQQRLKSFQHLRHRAVLKQVAGDEEVPHLMSSASGQEVR